ncbi:MAG: hypothetical protein P4L67_04315 [Candidatus Pacebacteria bacterium]|nr:hypothetical protein [Candidatus Paceibacterota bacterium]
MSETKTISEGDLVRRHDDSQVMRVEELGGGKNARKACCLYRATSGFHRGLDCWEWIPIGDLVLAEPDTTLADEVASVLAQLDDLVGWSDLGAYRRCRDRLRAALKKAKGERDG